MQGLSGHIPAVLKADYINKLLRVGFDTVDFGSFVSPKAIPQMADTTEVLSRLELTESKLLAIVANLRGAEDASAYDEIRYLGFPLSISETFQQRNTNKSLEQALESVARIQDKCLQKNKEAVIYISMAFGNPYGEAYDPEIITAFIEKLDRMDIRTVALSDTIGVASPEVIKPVFELAGNEFPDIEIGAHFHSNPRTALEKVSAAYEAGCRRFDGALKGFGGCPMAKDDLTGNIATEVMIEYFTQKTDEHLGLDLHAFSEAYTFSAEVFPAKEVKEAFS